LEGNSPKGATLVRVADWGMKPPTGVGESARRFEIYRAETAKKRATFAFQL
jgi:hypothetical protein